MIGVVAAGSHYSSFTFNMTVVCQDWVQYSVKSGAQQGLLRLRVSFEQQQRKVFRVSRRSCIYKCDRMNDNQSGRHKKRRVGKSRSDLADQD